MYTNKNHYDKDNYNEILYSGIVGHIFKYQQFRDVCSFNSYYFYIF